MPAAIVTEQLTTSYGDARGIVDVDLTVEPGEVFGFLGPNGAGKTTLIRTLLDFLRPVSGSARVLGLDVHRDSIEVRRRTAYLPGDLELFEKLTGRAHLDWLGRLNGGSDTSRADELAERFDLDLDRPIKQLSKGNRQKVGLVQAFMLDADLLILDEPTSGLDPLMQREFHALVRETIAAGRTVFLSSHQLDEVQHVADRVGIIREGVLVTVEPVEAMQARAVRAVEIIFGDEPDVAALDRLEGVADLARTGDRVTLRLDGPIDPLIKALAAQRVEDLVARPLDLDEVFLTYYGPAPDAAHRGDPESGSGSDGG